MPLEVFDIVELLLDLILFSMLGFIMVLFRRFLVRVETLQSLRPEERTDLTLKKRIFSCMIFLITIMMLSTLSYALLDPFVYVNAVYSMDWLSINLYNLSYQVYYLANCAFSTSLLYSCYFFSRNLLGTNRPKSRSYFASDLSPSLFF